MMPTRRDAQDFAQMILDNLKIAGVQQAHKDDQIVFTALAPWPGSTSAPRALPRRQTAPRSAPASSSAPSSAPSRAQTWWRQRARPATPASTC